jgi:poly(3-hydroxybutyrate) depolymerase
MRVSGRWCSLAGALLLVGCGDESWTPWLGADGGVSLIVTTDVSGDAAEGDGAAGAGDGGDAIDGGDATARDAGDGDASDGRDASDGGDVDDADDAGAISLPDVGVETDAGPDPIDAPVATDAGFDAGSRVDVGFDVPLDRGSVVDVPVDRGSVVDVAVDRGSVVDVGFDVPVDRGSVVDVGFDVPVDRGSPIDTGVDVPVDRGSTVDTGVDVPVDRGGAVDTGVDVPIDRGGVVDSGPTGVPPADPVAYAGSFAARTGRFTANLTVLGERRSIVLVVPTNAGASPPLLLLFHGTNGDGAVVMTESNAQALANSVGVIVAAPTSRWRPSGDFDHATEETYWETAPNADVDNNQDVVLARAIMVEAQRAYGVDPRRIYAMGHSNGAFFAEFIAVLLRDRIAAYSENSGGLVRCARTTGCRFQGSGATCAALRTQSGYCTCAGPELPVAVPPTGRMPPGFLTHGTRDPLVSVFYTCTLADLMTARGHAQVTQLFNGDGHAIPPNWAQLVWPFFAARSL